MKSLHLAYARLARNDTARGIAATLSILSVLALVDTMGMLPLSGTATPMYGPPLSTTVQKERAIKKKAVKRLEKRKANKRAVSSPSNCSADNEQCIREKAIADFYTQQRPDCMNAPSDSCKKALEKAIADAIAKAKK